MFNPSNNNYNAYNGGGGNSANMNQNYPYMQPSQPKPRQQPSPFQPAQIPQQQQQQNKFHPQQQYPQQQQQQQVQQPFFNPLQQANLFNDPMANMAVKYGANLADQGKEYVAQNVDRWFSLSKLKYYFAVDTSYVAKKLMLLFFPFFNKVRKSIKASCS
jgi:hypothetical protein